MYFDRHGKPAADGHYEKINGKLTIRNGGRITFDVQLMDGRPARGALLTDAASTADPRKAIKEARSAWLADKASAYRADRASRPAPSHDTGVEQSRQAWLRDKETAYLGKGR